MVLHGIYDNGNIILTDKELPKIKAKIEIKIEEFNNSLELKEKILKKIISKRIFSTINNPVKWQNSLRNEW